MTLSAIPSSTAPTRMAAERLWHAAAAVLALMPVGMAIAHRSAPAFLGTSAVLVLCALVAGHGLDRLLRQARTALSNPLGWSVLAFFGWALLSISWSEVRATSWRAFGEFWPAVAAAFVLSLALPGRVPRSTLWFVAGSLAVACVAMLVELQSGLSFRKSLGVRAWEFIFNRPALTVMVTAVPVLAWLASRPAKPTLAAAAVVAGLTATLIAISSSGAATLGLVLMIVTFPVALMLPRFALTAVALGFVAAFALAPVKGLVGDSLIPAKLHARLAESHSRERMDVWLSFGAAIRQQPILGAGFGASPRLHQTSVAAKVAPERRTLLNIGHPHDAAMQIWTELGAVGAALAVLIGLLTLRTMRASPARTLAPALTLLVGVTAASLVGHGAWQGWWAAAVGAAIVWLRTADHHMRASP